MKSKSIILAGALLVCLVLVIAALLAAGGSQPDAPAQNASGQGLQITELCAKNETLLADNDGKHPDYIELYNPGPPINLKGYTFTDGISVSSPLGDLPMDTHSYRVIFLGAELGGFRLGAGGGELRLLDSSGAAVAQVSIPALSQDQVLLRQKDGYVTSFEASPGFPNDGAGIAAFREGNYSENMPVRISEVLIANQSSLPDENGRYRDVIELCNASSGPVRLSGWYLSDSVSQRYRFRLPELTLDPGGYLTVYCDGENYLGAGGEIHANFALTQGETLCLTDNLGNYHCVTVQYLGDDVSLALREDGSYSPGAVSLGFVNDAAGADAFAAARLYSDSPLVISEVLLSSAGVPYKGLFQDAVEIYNRSDSPVSTAGWYLTDDARPYRYSLPEGSLAPGECMVIPCSKEVTGFSLSEGETLRLTAPDFRYAPQVICGEGGFGQSMSLRLSADDSSYTFGAITLGYENLPENGDAFEASRQPQALMISEVMPSNTLHLQGASGTACDWVELYNCSGKALELSGYTLADSRAKLQKYPLPQLTLAPGQRICILLSEDAADLPSGYYRLPFSLSASGEGLYLSRQGIVEDYVLLPQLQANTAYGRAPGSSGFSLLASPTPGKANSQTAAVSAPVTALTQPGIYNGVEYLDVTLSAPGTIYYTTNCTVPGRSAQKYTGPIRITKTTVLRVVCYEEGKQASQVTDLTYLLNENDSLGVISVVTAPANLWSEDHGMYVSGPGWTEEYPHYGANYWKYWEYPATISLFDSREEGFTGVPCGLKIFGGYSRANSKKSLACMFRAEYGASALDYPIFGEDGLSSYESIVLRAGGQDTFMTRIRDEVITSYANRELGIPVQKYRPVVVYLNGKYYGIHFVREKINENYVAGNFQVAKEDVDLTYWDGPNSPAYRALLDYARKNDLSQQVHFDYIASQVDLQNYTDYMIAQMWLANTDTANNKFFSTPEHPWTWVLYDTDLAMRNWSHDSAAKHLDASQLRNIDVNSKVLLLRLLQNEEYRDYFLRRTAWQCNQVWVADKLIAHIDALQEQVADTMQKDCKRWNNSYQEWLAYVEQMRSFARRRTPSFLSSLQRYFGLTDQQMSEYGFVLED
ncbi:MAG: lamin tail domain-containing protein [Oscillospiraceae bacterium]|nr:lamin tail domain-containing protein [Oscillospiraceae bacterium]